ncbi:metallophosphoesterase family protein [Liquorilactobacillus satsumensis]|uniref:metallophosphoesterase family protein n=1 Tax=Liquorilactobacillus satsumensis TaxID=259059 RepID=UPI001E5AC05E|nr:metallophosphoesterase family protein [Liquorilactobacillus satsumensis]MCC7666272.1 metallophosphoesterase [Liquorilactobacillus satsumensis]
MATKIALFSDVHGNLAALNAFYASSKQLGATEYWFLGDLFGPGDGAQALWDKMQVINPTVKIRGNWNDFFLNCQANHDQIAKCEQKIAHRLTSYTKTRQAIAAWPLHLEKRVNGVYFGLSHNLPTHNYGDSLSVRADNQALAALFADNRQPCDVAIYAHIHHPTMRYVDLHACSNAKKLEKDYNNNQADERLVLNIGSVGMPFDRPACHRLENRAEFLLLTIEEDGTLTPDFKRVAYQ